MPARPPSRGRRARRRRSGRVGRWLPCRLSVSGLCKQLTEPRKAREHPALDRTDGLSESFRELRLAEAAVVRQLEASRCWSGSCFRADCTRSRSKRSHASSSAEPDASGSTVSLSGSARRRSSRRTRSTARRWTSVSNQVLAFPRSGMKRSALRQAVRKPSCTASSASLSSRRMRRASPYADPAEAVVELGERRLVRARKQSDDRLVGEVCEGSRPSAEAVSLIELSFALGELPVRSEPVATGQANQRRYDGQNRKSRPAV